MISADEPNIIKNVNSPGAAPYIFVGQCRVSAAQSASHLPLKIKYYGKIGHFLG